MPSLLLVDARELERWANSRRAQEQVPALIRRLIHATTSTATHVGLPAGDAVQQGGYDGAVIISETHFAVPDGVSVWETGVSTNPKGKADGDYETRKASQPVSDIGPIDPATTTFVFVTPRRWNAKAKWAEERRSEGFFRDVRVLDADDLEAWLEQAPATHVWLSTQLGRRPVGADDLEAVWRDWSESTTPAISQDLMFAGRESCRDDLRAWFTSASAQSTLGVESESPDETLALVAAALVSLPSSDRVASLARTVVVRDVDALVQVAASDEPLSIVTTFSPGDVVHRATRRGHRVLIPRSPGEGVADTFTVPRLHRDAAERELKAMGVPEDRARALGGLARRSIMALRRQLATSAAVSRPAWAASDVGPSVLPMLLLGAVNEGTGLDIEALATLSAESADVVRARLTRFAAEADPAVRRVGSVWYLVSKADAWEALSRYITRDPLERFVTVALGVLGSSDPAYDLPPEQRWAAALYGEEKKPRHSGRLVRSVADTLALLGARGSSCLVAAGVSAADFASKAVRELFERAGRDWRRWASLAPVFPSLAEAAPDAFLAVVEAGLTDGDDGPSPVIGLFGHDVDSTFGSSPHTPLLWALERVTWSPDYLSRAALILAELARRDPGGTLSNRPSASLRSIFLPWMPATAAPVELRFSVIDVMRRREPDATWALMASLLPRLHDSNMRAARPDWRDWAPEGDGGITHRALADHAAEMVTRLLEDAGTSAKRWATLVEALDDVPLAAHEAILAGLNRLAGAAASTDVRTAVWDTLRTFLSRHRSFSDADWALPPDRVDAIATVFASFEPDDPVARDRYLFSHRAALPEGRERDHQERQRVLAERRVEAARGWYASLSVEALVETSASLEHADTLGDALATSGAVRPDDEPALIGLALQSAELAARIFARAYLGRRHRDGSGFAIPDFLRAHGATWSVFGRVEALLAMPQDDHAWAEAEALGEEGRTHYWRNLVAIWVAEVDLPRVLRELVRHGRPHAAVDLAAMHVGETPRIAAADAVHLLLSVAAAAHDVTGERSSSYQVATLLTFLTAEVKAGRIAEDEVARLELLYLPVLRHQYQPELLHRAMRKDPSLFIDAVCLAYRGESEPPHDLDDAARAQARLADELLSSWRTPPGVENGIVDGVKLTEWVTEARRRLAEENRTATGDRLIGEVLSGSPPGVDGAWPAEPIRDLIETIRSDDLESGLHIGRINRGGFTSRSLLAGGALERDIQASYEAAAALSSARWPRTAALLRTLAASYRRDAAREDVDAELLHDLDI